MKKDFCQGYGCENNAEFTVSTSATGSLKRVCRGHITDVILQNISDGYHIFNVEKTIKQEEVLRGGEEGYSIPDEDYNAG